MRRFLPHALMALLLLSLLPAAQVIAQQNPGQKGAFADEKTRPAPSKKLAPDSMTRGKANTKGKAGLIGLEQDGIHTTTYNSIMKCDVDIRGGRVGSGVQVVQVQTARGVYGARPTKRKMSLQATVGGKKQGVQRFELNPKGVLMLIGEDGKQVAAAPGVYSLSNGKKLHIGQAGAPAVLKP